MSPTLPPSSNIDLTGARVLIVEDEFMIADYVRELVLEAGASEVLVAVNVAQASAYLSGQVPIDIALVDINLGPESGYPVALKLKKAGIPFAFASGYGRDRPGADGFDGVPSISKPYTSDMVLPVLAGLLMRPDAQDKTP
jgi:DNA-binding response OmpR family regulator